MRILIVDDDLGRTREIIDGVKKRFGGQPESWTAQSSDEAIRILAFDKATRWDMIFLDHDLLSSGEYCDDGQTVAQAMVDIGVKARRVIIQSVNWWGAPIMKGILSGYKVTLAPYPDVLLLLAGVKRSEWRQTRMMVSWKNGRLFA